MSCWRTVGLFASLLVAPLGYAEETSSNEVGDLIDWLLADEARLEDIAFADVVEATAGKSVLPVDPEDAVDQMLLASLASAMDSICERLSAKEHPVHRIGRINEVSRVIEDELLAAFSSGEGLVCEIPRNASGDFQRSGYPDIRLADTQTSRVFYLDPKVYKAGSETSRFRTFYFEPKLETNKILDDASHLIIGIAHGGKVDGYWRFESWSVVDLSSFRVRLKAEFQASNRDLYQDSAILLKSSTQAP